MQNKIGVYFVPTHDKNSDWDYIKQLNPSVIRIMDASNEKVKRLYNLLPNAIIYPRYWSISEDQARYKSDPVGLAKDHVNFWRDKIKEYESFGMDRNRFVTVSQNEPTIWSNANRNQDYNAWLADMKNVYRYNLEYNLTLANDMGKHGIKSTLLGLSVGHPANLKDAEPPYWGWAEPLVEPTLKYGHIWELHEYWSNQGPQQNWGWWAGRWTSVPFDVPIIIGECGIDKYVEDGSVSQHKRGWQAWVTPKEYAKQINSYAAHLELDERVFGTFVFLTDFASRDWASFNTEAAHSEILKEKSVNYETYLPVIINTGTPPEPPVEPSDNIYRLKWPVLSPITQFFGGTHEGLDIGVQSGTPIYAISDGDVAWVDFEKNGYGNYVRVWHKHLKVHSFVGHCSVIIVKQGDKVKKGQLLGYSGNTGNSTGNHTHWEIRMADSSGAYLPNVSLFSNGRVDPLTYLYALDSVFGHE
jgi:hypothetical protein